MSTTLLGKSLIEAGLLHKRIADRAYQLYEARGYKDGHAIDDWVQAETEIEREMLSRSQEQTRYRSDE